MKFEEFKATKAILCHLCGDKVTAKSPNVPSICDCGNCEITEYNDGEIKYVCKKDSSFTLLDSK